MVSAKVTRYTVILDELLSFQEVNALDWQNFKRSKKKKNVSMEYLHIKFKKCEQWSGMNSVT